MVELNNWSDISWKQANRQVFRLQKRIYQATQRGDYKSAHKLQKLLIKSWYGRVTAVKKVTQDNRGKNTAGVDGVKNLSPSKRIKLANEVKMNGKAKPVRRISIPKKGTSETRPLGIPTIEDRAKQALAKLALEPEWEAKFEPNSYGFRTGRSAHDAIAAIYADINKKDYYVLDADIEKCFDRINHEKLLEKLNTFPSLQQQVKAWLKAGFMENLNYIGTDKGTPQGGVISPLLANIALHGLETLIKERYPIRYTNKCLANKYNVRESKNLTPPIVHRYADDFVILHESKELLTECKEVVEEWLQGMGLNLKETKTRIAHTRNKNGVQWGFDFLGFNVRQYDVKEENSGYNRNGKPLGFKTLIKPSKESITRHLRHVKEVIRTHRNAPQEAIIMRLNPIIRGWSNYYSTVVSSRIFSTIDNHVFSMLKRWAAYRSPMENRHKVMGKYWSIDRNGRWDFQCGNLTLLRHCNTKINYHIRLKGNKSPYDGDWAYWTNRMVNYPHVSNTVKALIRKQKGKCAYCGHNFHSDDILEIDHIQPIITGGKRTISNTQLLHGHCHDRKTSKDGSLSSRTNNNG